MAQHLFKPLKFYCKYSLLFCQRVKGIVGWNVIGVGKSELYQYQYISVLHVHTQGCFEQLGPGLVLHCLFTYFHAIL